MSRNRLLDPRGPRGRRPDYGSLSGGRRQRGASFWFSIGGLVTVLLLTVIAWRAVDNDAGSGASEPARSTDDNLVVTTLTPEPNSGSRGSLVDTATPVPGTPSAPGTPRPGATDRIALPSAPPPVALNVPAPDITAAAAIVLDGDSLDVLYERNAHERRQPASLTKMVTAMVAVEHADLEAVVASHVHHWDLYDSTAMGLIPGDEVTIRDLLYGLMLVSGNDAAQVLARHVAGSEEAFVVAMNLLIERLQLTNTRFSNVHGLSGLEPEPPGTETPGTEPPGTGTPGTESPGSQQPSPVPTGTATSITSADDQYSTAYDLALLARHLMQYDVLRDIVGTEEYTAIGTREGAPHEYYMYNHNPLLNYTPGVDGVKTGFTEEAGRTFAVSAIRDGHRIFVVLLDAPDRAGDAIALIDWAYEAHEWVGE